ncbi:uncharacterized protein [Primulina eburnea]|uniref:uncharacterized protein n=1 Tax=Primulina eburnea TaxID=1245227 RepID=UPI003C6C4C89
MENPYAFESVSKSFQDIMENQIAFGGKTMVLVAIFDKCYRLLNESQRQNKLLQVFQCQHSAQDIEFSQFLLRIGDGLQHTVNRDFLKLPDSVIIPWEGEQSIHMLIDSIFPNMINHVNDEKYIVDRAIITPKNVDVDNINQMFILKFPGEKKEYTSWDSVEDDNHNIFQE